MQIEQTAGERIAKQVREWRAEVAALQANIEAATGEDLALGSSLAAVLESTPQQPQRQDGTSAQLRDLGVFANRLGLYDAADYLRVVANRADAMQSVDAS